jgi:ethanolamine ammonia-lyase small subunit
MEQPNVNIEAIVQAVVAELRKQGQMPAGGSSPVPATTPGDLVIDLPDPTLPEARRVIGVDNPYDAEGLRNLRATTTARICVGRAGPRPKTQALLLFQADHGVTQDAIYGVVTDAVKEPFGLFTVQTMVADRDEYLLRPDLGRKLSDEAKRIITERCVKNPQVQIVVGDGLSAAAVNNNLQHILPVITDGLKSAGITVGTPFFIQNARVGVINDVGQAVNADMVVILLGERPGLGVADAMSAYMGYKPGPGKTDAERDVICMITYNGGTNPLEAGAYVVELIKKTLKYKASGVELKRLSADES